MCRASYALVSILLLVSSALAQVVDPQNVLIRNVQLIEGAADEEATIVSVLIKDNKLFSCG